MRYEDWDVLLFPKGSRVPLKEFKTSCHVVHDSELSQTNGCYGLPTLHCFVPSLTAGATFNVSLHSWSEVPELSQYTRTAFSNHTGIVRFEVRITFDGNLVYSSTYPQNAKWPQLLGTNFEFTKSGDLNAIELKFPAFDEELLRESYWSPSDDRGRIKVIISEAFPRDSLTVPTERVKNIVAFAFQHAPVEHLESACIAWPNASMWQRVATPYIPAQVAALSNGSELHAHSPRRQPGRPNPSDASSSLSSNCSFSYPGMGSHLGVVPVPRGGDRSTSSIEWAQPVGEWTYNASTIGRCPPSESREPRQGTVPKGHRESSKRTNTDVSMPDYASSSQYMSDLDLGEMGPSFPVTANHDPDASASAPKVPTNTPTALPGQSFVEDLLAESGQSSSGTPSRTTGDVSADYFLQLQGAVDAQARAGFEAADVGTRNITAHPHDWLGHPGPSNNFPSSDSSASLTNSLLNQPVPFPPSLTTTPATSSIPLPATEVKSRKEAGAGENYRPSSGQNSPAWVSGTYHHVDMRKVSQPAFASMAPSPLREMSREASGSSASTSNNTSLSNSFSGVFSPRSGSVFGEGLPNGHAFPQQMNPVKDISTPRPRESSVGTPRVCSGMGPGSDKGTKRSRHFTPARARAVDKEDESRPSTPGLRVGFGDQGVVG